MHTDDSETLKIKKHALPTKNTTEDLASQNPKAIKMHEPQEGDNITEHKNPDTDSNKIPLKNESQESMENTENHKKDWVAEGKGDELDNKANDDPPVTENMKSHKDLPESSSQNTLERSLELLFQNAKLGDPLT